MTEVFGMSLRDYKSWQKLQRVFHLLHSKHSITEVAHAAGFTDSAHLSRTSNAGLDSRRPTAAIAITCG